MTGPGTTKLGIGTAQFGMNYGIANGSGHCSLEDVSAIIRLAASSGVRVVDTSPGYGNAQEVLGRVLPSDHGFHLVTKIPALPRGMKASEIEARIRGVAELSLTQLRQQSLYGLIVHAGADLLGPDGSAVWRAMEGLREEGKFVKLGASAGSPNELGGILERWPIELAQVPFNLLDQRVLSTGQLRRLKERGVEVHARSVFLQGLILMHPDDIAPALAAARPGVARIHGAARQWKMPLLDMALSFAMGQPEIDHVVVGTTKLSEFIEVLEVAGSSAGHSRECRSFAMSDEAILDPRQWPQSLIHH